MPHWSSRLHLGSPTSGSASNADGKPARIPSHPNPKFETLKHNSSLLRAPVLTLADSIAPAPPQKPRHGRSYSNPTTSILGSGKRSEKVFGAEAQFQMVDTLEYPVVSSHKLPQNIHMAGARGLPSRYGEAEQVTGNCGTCGSVMKWPRQVDSYRCQICLMINDLKLSIGSSEEALAGENPKNTATKNCTSYCFKLEPTSDCYARSSYFAGQNS